MVNEIIREVNMCLDNGCCIAGLSLALTLPDICGKALYPELEKQTKQRYIKWFDEYIGQYERSSKYKHLDLPYLSGELVYSLRCSLLHQGNPNIKENEFGIIYFELVYRQNEGSHITVSSAEARVFKDENGNEKAVNKKLCINVRDLCWKICRLAEVCYAEDTGKFNFFHYNLVDTDYYTSRLLGLRDRRIIK